MSDVRLEGFVHEALRSGAARSEIEAVLIEAGWARDKVASALSDYTPLEFAVPVPAPRANISARDAALYLLLFGTLYYGVFNLVDLVFQFINLAFPDPSADETRRIVSKIRWSTSAVLVATPAFAFVAVLINRMVRADPMRRTSGVRKWLTYLTLALAAGVVVGDLVVLVNSLLSGELTARFLLKAAAVAAAAGSVLWYCLRSVRADEAVLER